jgi:hypothetical protein
MSRKRVEDEAAAAQILQAQVHAHVALVLPPRPARHRPRNQDPAGEVDKRTHQKEPGVQMRGLMAKHFVLLDVIGVRPRI